MWTAPPAIPALHWGKEHTWNGSGPVKREVERQEFKSHFCLRNLPLAHKCHPEVFCDCFHLIWRGIAFQTVDDGSRTGDQLGSQQLHDTKCEPGPQSSASCRQVIPGAGTEQNEILKSLWTECRVLLNSARWAVTGEMLFMPWPELTSHPPKWKKLINILWGSRWFLPLCFTWQGRVLEGQWNIQNFVCVCTCVWGVWVCVAIYLCICLHV